MKNIIFIIACIMVSLNLLAHEGGHGTPQKDWKLASEEETFKADLIK